MAKRRRYRNGPNTVWRWISFVAFLFILLIFGISIIKKQSPAQTISSLFKSNKVDSLESQFTKKELLELLSEKDGIIEELSVQLDTYEKNQSAGPAKIRTSSDALNMRNCPSLSGDIILKIPNGLEVTILYYDSEEIELEGQQGKWCKVKYDDQEGWVWSRYLEPVFDDSR